MNEGPTTAADFDPRYVVAAESVIVEIWQILGAYRDALVLIGGSVPRLLLPEATISHVGTLDVDLLLDPEALTGLQYADLVRQVEARGYRQKSTFQYERDVPIGGGDVVTVRVDFLVPKGSRRGRSGRFVKGFRAVEADGASLATHLCETTRVSGLMPSGAYNEVEVRLPRIEAYVVVKAHALAGRLKEKDAYDLVYCLQHFEGSSEAVADRLKPHRHQVDVDRALTILAEKFASPDHYGPRAVGDFLSPADLDERSFVARDAYERVQVLLKAVEDH